MTAHPALAEAAPTPYWLDSPDRPAPAPPLPGDTETDLVVVGAGYTGLWTALLAKERDPYRDVLLLDARRAGWAASGRNGGFCAASLTHGLDNGLDASRTRWRSWSGSAPRTWTPSRRPSVTTASTAHSSDR